MNATVEAIAQDALTRADRWLGTLGYRGPRSVLYRRIGLRQRQLFQLAAGLNADYFGASADVDLDVTGAADLADVVNPVPEPSAIQRVEILFPGTSRWPRGHPIRVVSAADPRAAIAPRMTLRSGVFDAYGADLDGVRTIRVLYARQPKIYTAADGGTAVELPSPDDELLVLDAQRFIVTVSLAGDALAAASTSIAAEESLALAAFRDSITAFVGTESRFSRPPSGVAPAKAK